MKKLNLLRAISMLLLSVIILYGCREELKYTENFTPPKPHQDGRAKNISFKQFQKETRVNIKNISQSINRTSKNFKTQNYIDEFQIDTTFIKKLIYQKDKTSFTIRAFKRGENPKNISYNIVYHKVNDKWKAEIFKYTYDEKFLKDYNENALTPFSGKIQYLRTENVTGKTSDVYTCEYAVVPLCYCADHTTLMCNGCGQGFRDVGLWICKPVEESGGGTVNPYEPNISWPPFNDVSGGSTANNPYDIEYQNNLPVYDDPVFLETTWKYNLWNSLGNMYSYDTDLYLKFEEFQVLTKGQRIQDLINLSNFVQDNNQFAHFGIDFLISNTQNGVCSISKEQFQKWFINADGTSRITFDNTLNDSNTEHYNSWQEFFTTENKGFTSNLSDYTLGTNDNNPQQGDPFPITNSRAKVRLMKYHNTGLDIKVRSYDISKNTFNLYDIIVNQYGLTTFWSVVFEDSNNKWDKPVYSTYNGNIVARFDVHLIIKKGVKIKDTYVTVDSPITLYIFMNPVNGNIINILLSYN